MSTEYRVDRVSSKRVPCGMNSIRYCGGSQRVAQREFDSLTIGYDAWDKADPRYGVILSRWVGSRYDGDYKIIDSKGV